MEKTTSIEGQLATEIVKHFNTKEGNETAEAWEHVFNVLRTISISERHSEQYSIINEHKKRIRKRYSKEIDSLIEVFPNGIFTKDKHGHFVGINVMMKSVISGILELRDDNEKSKK